MHEKTEENMKAAFAGESQAHIKYMAFSDKAEREGMKNIGRLFKAVAFAETVHATSHLRALGLIGKTQENLKTAVDGETYEVEEMYPAFLKVAAEENETAASRSMDFAVKAEAVHADLYKQALQAALSGQDVPFGDIYICSVCGYAALDEAPDKCPVCGASKDKFKLF